MNNAEEFFDDEVVEYPPQRQAPRNSNTAAPRQAPPHRAQQTQAPRNSNTQAPRQAPPAQRGKTKTKDEMAEEFFSEDDEADFQKADTQERLEWLPPGGSFVVSIRDCYLFTSRQRRRYCVVQMEVLSSSLPDVPVGDLREWLVPRDTDTCLGNLKKFLTAALNPSPEDPPLTTGDVRDTFNSKAILADIRVAVRTQNTITEAGTDFTKHMWSPAK